MKMKMIKIEWIKKKQLIYQIKVYNFHLNNNKKKMVKKKINKNNKVAFFKLKNKEYFKRKKENFKI